MPLYDVAPMQIINIPVIILIIETIIPILLFTRQSPGLMFEYKSKTAAANPP
jgi:hypothetical protein